MIAFYVILSMCAITVTLSVTATWVLLFISQRHERRVLLQDYDMLRAEAEAKRDELVEYIERVKRDIDGEILGLAVRCAHYDMKKEENDC